MSSGMVMHIFLGIALAAAAGLRAWLPMLVVGLLGRFNVLSPHPSMAFLNRTDVLVVLGVATVVEVLADKVPVLDHILDALSTFIRPTAGAVLVYTSLQDVSPAAAFIFSTVVGGGTALSVHSAKASIRTQSTALAPAHGGLGNTALSFLEDIFVGGLLALVFYAPWAALILALLLLSATAFVLYRLTRAGLRLVQILFKRRGENPSL